ncbi:hypothetical protein FJZ48_01135 [Candidatus Uhrbacteria bacterium]|nr:hypothetical protein [Candidatus Uhrbacteria bacterium]
MSKPRLFILDANALLHRAWHALPPLTNLQKPPTSLRAQFYARKASEVGVDFFDKMPYFLFGFSPFFLSHLEAGGRVGNRFALWKENGDG